MSAKRINISIPDGLADRAEQWKDKFSPSELYQEALEEFVSKKEQLAERLKGEPEKMEAIVDRLNRQKKAAEQDFFVEGQEEGANWAKTADYLELKYAAEGFNPFESAREIGGVYYDWVMKDDDLGEYFGSLKDECPKLWKTDDEGRFSGEAEKFLEGWLEAVGAFWEEVSTKLDS